jgi:hypothetical protein
MKTKTWGLLTTLLVVFISLVMTPVLAAGDSEISWYVIGGGGGPAESSVYTLNGTIGQSLVGISSDSDRELCSGFWCLSLQWVKVYLPIIFR